MTKRFNISCLTPLGLLLAASPALVSQVTTGQVSGRVTDANNRPIRATITLTAPQLMGQRELPTDANGEWRAMLLPPGDYTIRISATGFIGATIRNLRVGTGAALRQDRVLRAAAVATETVEISGSDAAVVDKSDTKSSTSFSADLLSQLTGSRDFYAAADLATGVTWGASGNATVRGGQVNTTIYRLDGADIKDPIQGQVDARWYVNDLIEDVAVVLSPTNARFGRTLGGSIDVVTKSGGNEFSGTFRVSANRTSWEAKKRNYREYADDPNSLPTNDGLTDRSQDFTLTGPIIKDRLWFAFGATIEPEGVNNLRSRRVDERYKQTVRASDGLRSGTLGEDWFWHDGINNLFAVNPDTLYVLPTAAPQLQGFYNPLRDNNPGWWNDQPYTSTSNAALYYGKVTWGITQDHKLTFGGQYQPWEFKGEGGDGVMRPEMRGDNSYMAQGVNVSYNGILGSKTFAEFKFNRQKQTNRWNESDSYKGAWGPVWELWQGGNPDQADLYDNYDSIISNGRFAGRGSNGMEERNNAFGSINVTMFRDFWNLSHNIDVGTEYFLADRNVNLTDGPDDFWGRVGGMFENSSGDWLFPTLIYVGPNQWGQSASGNTGLAPKIWKKYGEAGTAKNSNLAFYFNDQMTINENWNVMVGLRFDRADAKNVDGSEIFSSTGLSPRFMLTYDPKGDSSNVFKFTYARMQLDYPLAFSNLFTHSTSSREAQLVWTGIPGQPMPGTVGDTNDPLNPGREMYGMRFVTWDQLNNLAHYGNAQAFTDSSLRYYKESGLKPMSSDEFALEFRRNYQGGSHLRMAYVYRVQSNLWAGTFEYDPSHWVEVKDFTGGGFRSMWDQTRTYFNTNKLYRDYHGIELETSTRVNSVFSWMLSYSYSAIRGNSEVGDSTSSWMDFAPPGYYNYYSYLNSQNVPMSDRSPHGALANDVPHKVRATVLAVVPVNNKGGWISFSSTLGYDSGVNWNATYGVAAYGLWDIYDEHVGRANSDSSYPLMSGIQPARTWSKWAAPRGAYHRNDEHWVDAQISWEIPIWKKLKTMGNISVWNVFNMHYQRSYNRDMYSDGTPLWGWGYYFPRPDTFGRDRNREGDTNDYAVDGRSVGLSMGLKF